MPAGADAAAHPDAALMQLIATDPEIRRVIAQVWGSTPVNQRPSDTPHNLEGANHSASQQIAQILQSKGIQLPDRTFINPRSEALEGNRGWAGLSGLQKALIIAATAATGVGAAGALGAFGGAGVAGGAAAGASSAAPAVGAGAGAAGLGVTSGLGSLAGVGATGVLPTALGTAAGVGGAAGAGAAGAGSSGLMKALQTAGKLGSLATGASQGLQAGRYADANQNLERDRLAGSIYNTQQNAQFNKAQQELQQRQFSLNAPANRAKQTALGDLLANVQDVNITPPSGIRMGNITGGLRPSALGPNARQAGGDLSRQALMALLDQRDQKFDPIQMIAPPQITPGTQPGKAENLLGILGTVGGLAGGFGESTRPEDSQIDPRTGQVRQRYQVTG